MSHHESRLVARLLAYWQKLKENKVLPLYKDFNSAVMEEYWTNCFVVSVKGSASRKMYRYEYMGGNIAQAYGRNMTGEEVSSSIRNVPGAQILTKLDQAVEHYRPVLEEGEFVNDQNTLIKYRACAVPFGSMNNFVTHIVVGLSWKAF